VAGLYQPIDRIAPVGPGPSILTSARPLAGVQAARAGAAALEAIEGKAEFDTQVHIASVGAHLDVLRRPKLGVYADLVDALEQVFVTLHDAKQGRAGQGPITVDDLYGISDAVWRTGVSWAPVSCQHSFNELLCPNYGEEDGREDPSDDTTEEAGGPISTAAFTIYTPLVCDWLLYGNRLDDDANALNDVHTAWGISRALWLGDGLPNLVDQPTLQRAAVDVSVGGVAANLDVVVAALLSEYEQATGGNGGAVLHIPSVGITGAVGGIPGGGRVAWPEGNYYRGPLGSIVSPGPGYPHGGSPNNDVLGYGPMTDEGPPMKYAGNDTDEFWVYVTGPIEYAVGAQSLLGVDEAERRNYFRENTYRVTSQRPAIVRFDTCSVFAAKANNYAGQVS